MRISIGKILLAGALLTPALTAFDTSGAQAADSLRTRAEKSQFSGTEKVLLHRLGGDFTPEQAKSGQTYEGRFVPVKDIFAGQVDAIRWDATAKTVSVANGGRSAVLNFSGEKIRAKEGEVVLPSTWAKMQNGKALIDIYTLTYVLDRYGDAYDDPERETWNKKLDFLGIQYAESLAGIRSSTTQVYITFK
ncbi:hypothetical protein QWJ34_00990 [Saccharibacillus sp. CPCC 101409]|uniref:hypothetical protein n=1 Tax=Saccharibacillus sp. CPCC 101409 TaxID=3058041 RepID=UPI002673B493|nr:hypothetical protein [Saccharibacillus sp. CPCC 101409]MDO3408335.1 hypothetical protein [Saccharibacillus sp. CPCC 101409]